MFDIDNEFKHCDSNEDSPNSNLNPIDHGALPILENVGIVDFGIKADHMSSAS